MMIDRSRGKFNLNAGPSKIGHIRTLALSVVFWPFALYGIVAVLTLEPRVHGHGACSGTVDISWAT